MTLLKDVIVYAIACDYFMCSEEKGEYVEKVYWAIDTDCANIIYMTEFVNDPNIRVFSSISAAKNYIKAHKTGYAVCYEKPRIVKLGFDFETKIWKEVE